MYVVDKKLIFDGKLLKLYIYRVETPDGIKEREVIEHRGAVAILAFIRDDEIIIERRYRPALNREVIEIPAGLIKHGEKPEEAASRELEEETGYRAKTLEKLVSYYPTVGYTNEIIHIYLAKGLEYVGKGNLETSPEEKYMKVETVKIDKILEMIKRGEVMDSKTIIAVLSYLLLKK